MTTEYTINKIDEIYFLNDKNIAQSLSDEISFNPIPSLSLLNTVNDNLIKKIDDDIQNINSELSAEPGKFITGINQQSGKITDVVASKLTDNFIENESISKSKISGLTKSLDDLSSNYVKKSGDIIDSLLINSNLSVGGQIINKNISTDNEGKVTIQGNGDKKHGSLNLNFEHGLKDIIIKDISLFESLQELSSNTINSLKYESDHKDKQFIVKVSQTNGTISSEARGLNEGDIPELSQGKIKDLERDLTNIRNEYLLSSNFKTSNIENDKGFVTGDQLSAIYHTVEGKSIIEISLNGYKQEINCADFIKDGMISEVKVENENLVITWNADSKKSDTIIPLSKLANIYKWGYGIDMDPDFTIKIDDKIVVTHDDFKGTETYVDQLKTNIINELSSNVKDSLARLKHTVKFDGIIEHYESSYTFKELFDSNTDYNGLKGSVRNNSLYKVNILENNKYNISSVFEIEGLSFTNSDYLFINEKTDENQIPTDDLKPSSIYVIKTGVSKIDFDTEIFDRISVDNELSKEINEISDKLNTEIFDRISVDNELSKEINEISINLNNEISTRTSVDNKINDWCSDLSSAIDTKTSVSSDNGLILGLSIKNISEKDYHDLVISGSNEPIDLSTLYIVSSDMINAYAGRIINVADPVDFNDATNKIYVDNKLLNLVQICANLSNSNQQTNTNVNTLKNNNSNIIRSINQDASLSVLLTDETDLENKISNSDIIRALQIILKNINN